MGLQKATALDTGVTASYWAIDYVMIDKKSRKSSVILKLYIDKQARDDGKEPIEAKQFEFASDDFCFTVQAMQELDPFKIAYNKIKTLPEFEGAVDA